MLNRPSAERCCDCSCSSAEIRRAGGCPLYLPQSSAPGRLHVPRHRSRIGWRPVVGALAIALMAIAFPVVILLDLRAQGWTLTP